MSISKIARSNDNEPRSTSHIREVALALRLSPRNVEWYIGIGKDPKAYTVKDGPGRGSVIRNPQFGVMLRNLAAGNVDLDCITLEPVANPMLVLDTLNGAGVFVARGSLGKMFARTAHQENRWRRISDWARKPVHCALARNCELIVSLVNERGVEGFQSWLACANAEYRARELPQLALRERVPGDNLAAGFNWHLE